MSTTIRTLTPIKLGTYQHYKGDLYQVLGVGRHTETLEEVVIYQALYGDRHLWVRPRTMFEENVTVGQQIKPRFTLIQQ